MTSLKDKYIFLLMFLLFSYILLRLITPTNNIYIDHIFISVYIFLIWYICFTKHLYVISVRELEKYVASSPLFYKIETIDDKVSHVYVSIDDEDRWYEMDYSLSLPLYSNVSDWQYFCSKNSTVYDLNHTMCRLINQSIYNFKLTNDVYIEKTFKYTTLILYIVFISLYWLGILSYNTQETLYIY